MSEQKKIDQELEKKRANNLLRHLMKDEKSIFYAVDVINRNIINKAARSFYVKDRVFVNIFKKLKDKNFKLNKGPLNTPFVEEKTNVDRSTLYSFKAPFELFHADIADIRFLAKSAVDPHYCLVLVDLFSNKIYTYPMKKRLYLANKLEKFYEDTFEKREKRKVLRLQTDLEFSQNKIKKLNEKFNVQMFSSKIRGGKAFAAERAIRDFKKILLRSKRLVKEGKKRVNSYDLIKKATNNLNNKISVKYDETPNNVEEKSLKSDEFREVFDIRRIYKIGLDKDRQNRYFEKIDKNKKKKLRSPLTVGEDVLILAARLKKKDEPGKLYKSSTENRPYFNREKVFKISHRVINENGKYYYWLQNFKGRFIRQELYALNRQFI